MEKKYQTKAMKNDNNTVWFEIRNLKSQWLDLDAFSISENETWCIFGENNSGSEVIPELLSGKNDRIETESLLVPEHFYVVSFDSQQELYEQEVRNDDSDYLNRVDPGTSARSLLGEDAEVAELVRLFNLEHVLDSGYRQLSSGEGRKILILEAITNGATSLLVENPYDGLDLDSCREFDRIAEGLKQRGVKLIVMLSSRCDIPGWCTHLLFLENGRVAARGARKSVLKQLDRQVASEWKLLRVVEDSSADAPEELVRLEQGTARYGERIIFSSLDLLLCKGEHTLVTGPNGSGKSTLLSIITGDHPDCYTNELYLFGQRRGSGESIWELKKNMGIVSPALHRNHYIPGNTLQIVISGFFDSIGLYRKFTPSQEALAREWLELIGLAEFQKTPFRQLSFARQRLALIARALIKMPKLLILDEPTQGLDDNNRENLLGFLEMVAEKHLSTILYVSHRRDEYRDFFCKHKEMPGS